MLGKVKTYAKEQFTGILDKYVPSSKYYRFEAPEQSMEQVERVLVRNDNIMIEAEKMVVGGRSDVGQKAIHVPVAESASMNAASDVVMEKQTPKQRFYANADRQRGITGANSRSRDAGNSAAEYEARKEQWNRESELLRMEIKYKAEQIATDLLGDANKKLSNRSTLRFGDTGKIAVKIEGGSAGNWYDFSADKGGDLFTLVQEQQNTDFKGAAEYLKSYTGMSSGVERNTIALVDDQRSSDNYAKYVQEQKYEAAKIAKAQKLYDSSREIGARSIAAKYLSETRNIDPAASEIGSDIKTALVYDKELGKKAPALIAFARSSEGDITGGQQIILDSSTLDKAEISVPKRSFGKISGSFVNLGYAGDNSEKSAITIIAEGIETGLSVKQALREHSEENGALIKTLCSLGISNIKNYAPSSGEKIIIAADNDGLASNTNQVIVKAAHSLEEKGAYVEVVLPAREGDFNDVLKNTDKSAAIEEIRSDFIHAMDKLDAAEKTTFVDHINKPEAGRLQDERSQVIENAPKQDMIAAKQELEQKPKNVMDQVQSSRLVEDIGEGLYKAVDTARQEDQSKALHSKPREYEYVADKYDNIYMDQVVGSYNYLRDTKEEDVRGTHNFYGAYDFAGNVHTKIDSYLLAVGQNKNIAALIDPKSEVGKEMNRLVAIEEAYQLDKTLPVKDRLSSTIMREIQENYQYLEDNFYEAKVKENQSIKIEDFSGNYHNDKSEYLHSVISDPQVQDKIDMGSEFGKVIEQELQRENYISYEKEIEIEP